MKQNENEELQSRRQFFKKAAKTALPMLAIAAFGQTLLTACDKEDEPGGCGNACSGSCTNFCSGGCSGGCSGDCDDGCTADCWNGCDRWNK